MQKSEKSVKRHVKQWIWSLFKRWGYVIVREDNWDFVNREMTRWLDRRHQIIQHPPVHGSPDIRVSQTLPRPGPRHIEIAERLIRAFDLAMRDESSHRVTGAKNDLWTVIQRGELASFWDVIKKRDPQILSEYLLRFGESGTCFGGLAFCKDGYNQSEDEAHIALSYFDEAVSLAEAMGCLRCENPEQGEWGENLYRNPNAIFDAIEREFGASITPPQHTTGVFGIQTSRGVFHYRHLNALYVAWRIRRMIPSPTEAVCEYGGGLGSIPYFLHALGIRNYTIYDLPLANVFAGHFLMNSLSPEDVVLYGETGDAQAIKVLPYWECRAASNKYFDVTINQDSFPEIDEAMVRFYLSEIQRTTRNYFVSINQEGEAPMPGGGRHLNVSRLMMAFPLFHRLHRSRYWIRGGYVEEIYRISDKGG